MATSDKVIFKWTIPEYNKKILKEEVESMLITIGKNENIAFTLSLQQESEYYRNSLNNIKFSVNVKEVSKEKPFNLICSYSILNDSNEKVITEIRNVANVMKDSYEIGDIAKTIIIDHLVKGNLILLYEMELNFETNLEESSAQDYEKYLFNNEKFSDISFLVEDEKIYAHKAILASRSPVFKKMFLTDMTESVSGHVKINEIEYKIFIEVLRFIYTGKVENFDQLALQILQVAHLYQLDDLVKNCEKVLLQNMNDENALEILKLADKYDLQMLKSNSIIFIQLHFKNFQNTPELEQLCKTHAHLLFEFVNQLQI